MGISDRMRGGKTPRPIDGLDSEHDDVELDVEAVKAATGKAILCAIDGDDYWIPLSLLRDGTTAIDVGDSGAIVVPQWFAEKEGLS